MLSPERHSGNKVKKDTGERYLGLHSANEDRSVTRSMNEYYETCDCLH